MASPFMIINGICCAMSTLAESCSDKHDYGQEAILNALRLQLFEMTEVMEWVEDLADAKDNPEKRESSIAHLTEWAEKMRARAC